MRESEQSLLLRAKRLKAALLKTTQIDIEQMELEAIHRPDRVSILADANRGMSDEDLANTAFQLVALIASLRDYLKEWCRTNDRNFLGDSLLEDNIHAAIVHDLWNIDKHAVLNRKSRSGYLPRLINLRRVAELTLEGESSSAFMMIGPTGVYSSRVNLTLSADVHDEHGNRLGDFVEVCEDALDAWQYLIAETTGLSILNQY